MEGKLVRIIFTVIINKPHNPQFLMVQNYNSLAVFYIKFRTHALSRYSGTGVVLFHLEALPS